MKRPPLVIPALLTAVLAAAAALPVVSFRRSSETAQAQMQANDRPEKRVKTPPEDSFLAQRVVHGGIPVGALEKARAQATRAAISARPAPGQVAAQAVAATWQFVGPTNIGGRIVDVAVDPVEPDTIYVAAATGGVWKSTDAGAHFTAVWPAKNPQSMGAMIITSNGTLFAGTGEANPGGGSITYGGSGVYRSLDRGATWERVGLTNSGRIGRIAVNPHNPQHIYVAASGDLFNPGGERGVYESKDGGSTWARVLAGDNDTTGAVDLAIDPRNPNRVFAAMWDHRREPDLRRYGGVGSGLYRTVDGGATWERLGGGLPAPDATIGRIGVAVATTNPQRVYAIVIRGNGIFHGFYRSEDGGTSWTNLPSDPQDEDGVAASQAAFGWWFGRLWVDPLNEAHVFAAGVFLCESQDGGATFTPHFSPHADHHAMAWDLKVPSRVYLGTDGGTYRSDTNGTGDQWTKAVHEPFTQFYSVAVSEQDASRIAGGTQDNGLNRSYGETAWNALLLGDGLAALINPVDQNRVYWCIQYGNCYRSTDGSAPTTLFTNAIPSSRRNWFAPLQFDPNNPAILYFGGTRVHRSTDHAVTWTPISPDLTGGPGRSPAYIFGTITTIGIGKSDPNRILAGTDDGRLWFTPNLGGAWTRVTDPDVPGTWVTRVAVDPRNAAVAYATFSGFRSGGALPYVLKTTDGGVNWTSISGDLPQAPVNDIVIVGSTLYVATDVGVFVSTNGGTTWLTAGEELPNVPVTDLEYRATSNSLYAATFGRGIYALTLPEGQALNISTRARVGTAGSVMIGGFIITGTEPKTVAVRGVGPSLSNAGLSDVLADPTLELRGADGALLAQNDDWQNDPAQAAQLAALGLGLQHPDEAGIVATLNPGTFYTAILAGKDGGTGVGLVEVYDGNQAVDAQLANISTRGFVQTGSNVMIGGFILNGAGNTKVVLRAIGPSLSEAGLSPVLADPTLELRDANGALLIANDDWQSDATSAAQLTAQGLAPRDPKESGIFASLPAGPFTAIVGGKDGGTGLGLVEVYNVQ